MPEKSAGDSESCRHRPLCRAVGGRCRPWRLSEISVVGQKRGSRREGERGFSAEYRAPCSLTVSPLGAFFRARHEAHLSAPQRPPGTHPRLPRPHVDPGRAQGAAESSPQGTQASRRDDLQEVAEQARVAIRIRRRPQVTGAPGVRAGSAVGAASGYATLHVAAGASATSYSPRPARARRGSPRGRCSAPQSGQATLP